ncbi:hypothetical protein HMPREF1549_02677 [Actinomyces johnsonii F0510]|uniref:Porphobilinogen deaminase N-terminal domain-containing protein n=1 Tax=Actinomyces johnsonii F0510 TaxID=1227262 RepID=U1Q1E5_9ACTO|nr:hypothetical protein HMPREF1549_02677 [Actinomyces johnsonii F0510]
MAMTTAGTSARRLRLGTRGSRLALTQSEQVADALRRAAADGARTGSADGFDEVPGLDIELVTVRTDGDGDCSSCGDGVGDWGDGAGAELVGLHPRSSPPAAPSTASAGAEDRETTRAEAAMRRAAGAPHPLRNLAAGPGAPPGRKDVRSCGPGIAMRATTAETRCHRAPRAPTAQVPATTASDNSLMPQDCGGTSMRPFMALRAAYPRRSRRTPDTPASKVSRRRAPMSTSIVVDDF